MTAAKLIACTASYSASSWKKKESHLQGTALLLASKVAELSQELEMAISQ